MISDADLAAILSEGNLPVRRMMQALDRYEAEQSLYRFVQLMWHVVEPETPFVGSWVLEAICEHLEAVTHGQITRLCINVYPGATKSLLTSVFWPAWEWGPQRRPHLRYLCFAYGSHLTERDNQRFRDVITSRLYQALWGSTFGLRNTAVGDIQNSKTGWKLASSVGGVGTGERGDRIIIDDGNKPPTDTELGDSSAVMRTTGNWFREVLPDRLNSLERSAIVNIQQRISEVDISGIILELELPYTHLSIPMRLDTLPDSAGRRRPIIPTEIGWIDPRLREDWSLVEADPDYRAIGEIVDFDELDARDGAPADPRRFPHEQLEEIRTAKGPFAWSSQYQQLVVPRGGGIVKEEYWQLWEEEEFPPYGTCVASLDTAYKEKQENDYSALTVWSAFEHPESLKPKLMLRDAWQRRLNLADLVRAVLATCQNHKVETLLIEDASRGIDVRDEIWRLAGRRQFGIVMVPAAGDKISRVHSCVPIFENKVVYAPDREYSDMVIRQMATFPSGRHDDLVDSTSMAMIYLRKTGVAVRHQEHDQAVYDRRLYRKAARAPYDV